MMVMAKLNQPEILKFLIKKGANVNARRDEGHTALIYAAYNGQRENVKALLAAGADPTLVADEGAGGFDAEDMAVLHGHPEIAAILRDAIAKFEVEKAKRVN
jgi:ankyrin repeat protein